MKTDVKAQKIFVALLVACFLFMLYPYLPSIAMGGILAVLLIPVQNYLVQIHWKLGWAAVTVTIGATLTLLLPLGILTFIAIKTAAEQFPKLMASMDQPTSAGDHSFWNFLPLDRIQEYLPSSLEIDTAQLQSTLNDAAKAVAVRAGQIFGALAAGIPSMILLMVLVILGLLFFLLYQKETGSLVRRHSFFDSKQTDHLIEAFKAVCQSLILATLVTGLIQAVFFVIGAAAMGLTHLSLIGFAIFIMSFIPAIGSAPVTFAIAAFYLIAGPLKVGLVLLAFALGVSFVDNLIRPILLKKGASLNPFLAIVAVIGGLALFGFPGVFIGPVVAALMIESYALVFTDRHPLANQLNNPDPIKEKNN